MESIAQETVLVSEHLTAVGEGGGSEGGKEQTGSRVRKAARLTGCGITGARAQDSKCQISVTWVNRGAFTEPGVGASRLSRKTRSVRLFHYAATVLGPSRD